MLRRAMLSCALVVALLALAAPARAGGWAVVTLDSLPKEVRAGQTLRLGFMVRQHGQTPNSDVDAYVYATKRDSAGGLFDRMAGVRTAHAQEDQGANVLRVPARQEGAEGHFVVDVTFPSAGNWEWEIVPAPFEGTKMAPLMVLPAAPVQQPAAATETVSSISTPMLLRVLGGLALVAAIVLALLSRRGARSRALAMRSQ
jgi:hypothetical protein